MRGVPYDVAFGLDDAERMAFVVTCGRLDGREFEWRKLRWNEQLEG
jgi:hypothetical protein